MYMLDGLRARVPWIARCMLSNGLPATLAGWVTCPGDLQADVQPLPAGLQRHGCADLGSGPGCSCGTSAWLEPLHHTQVGVVGCSCCAAREPQCVQLLLGHSYIVAAAHMLCMVCLNAYCICITQSGRLTGRSPSPS
jgi:hypothetical protein